MKTIFTLCFLLLFETVGNSQIYHVQDMTTTEIASLDREKTVVLLPGGILEQHGTHLPSYTDGYMNQKMTQEIANSITKKEGQKVLIFPQIPLGNGGANEIGRKYSFSGTYAVRSNTLRAILMDLGSELGDQGFKRIFVIHFHGAPNHNRAIDQASEYFTETYNGRMINLWNLAYDFEDDPRNEKEQKEDGFTVHAGMGETSIFLYLNPSFKTSTYKQIVPLTGTSPDDLVTISKSKDWPGYFGSPRLASAEFGERLWKPWITHICKSVDEILSNTYNFSKPTYAQLMSSNPVFKLVNEDAKKFDKGIEARQTEWLKKKGLD